LRQQGWTAEEIGAVLGEQSGKISRWYGSDDPAPDATGQCRREFFKAR